MLVFLDTFYRFFNLLLWPDPRADDAVGERETAELLFENLKQIAPEHETTKETKRVLYPSLIGRIFRRLMRWR